LEPVKQAKCEVDTKKNIVIVKSPEATAINVEKEKEKVEIISESRQGERKHR